MSRPFVRLLSLEETQSSNLASIGYNISDQALYVTFRSSPDTMYVYTPVNENTFAVIVTARSMGGAFSDLVKKDPRVGVTKVVPSPSDFDFSGSPPTPGWTVEKVSSV